jgi:predicted tellurium resistance membrane protein TerC
MKLTAPLFHLPFLSETDPHLPKGPMGITGQDLVFLLGGLFLLFKSVKEIHHKLEGADEPRSARVPPSFSAVMVQIMLVNIVFSLDSVITAVGMVDKEKVGGLSVAIGVMIAAVLLSTVFMIFTARPVGEFVDNHPTVKMLALAFLILIGVNLLAEGFHQHIPKGYTYFAMAFAIGVEMLNLRMKAKTAQPVHLHKTLR